MYQSREICVKYKGKKLNGIVEGTVTHNGKRVWSLRFEDGYVMLRGEKTLRKLLKPVRKIFVKKSDRPYTNHQ